nr:putative zinc finger, C2H2-like protein [Tanacetum cinerariifolium]
MDVDHDEMRFVCKLCDKRCPSGKSLGGHMRSHVFAAANANANTNANAKLVESDDKYEPMKKVTTLIINGNENSTYGLRENPKKSWKSVGLGSSNSTLAFQNEQVCKQCGKGFQSLKALCGHMAFHSDKDRGLKNYDYSWTSEKLDYEDKFVEDTHSDTEENEMQDKIFVTRSKTKRYKKIIIKPPSYCLTNASTSNNNSNYNYGSSSVSEIDEFDQEDVAMWLIKLSKDTSNWDGVNSVAESSDSDSVDLETKLSRKEWNMVKNETESVLCENSNGMKKVESDISVDELLKNGDQHKNKSNEVTGFNYRHLSYEEKQEIRRNLFREFGYDESLKKRIRDEDDYSYKKRNKYECMNCNKVFSSFQGLGGHRPCHRKNIAEGAFARDQKAKFEKKTKSKKTKGHECPICFRMFKSGQALGGHKRSHFLNSSEDRYRYMAAMEGEGPSYTDMIDLNLPAPEED